ncbi:MAG: c-type cytochrome [Zoogloea sp.]|uniref:c-type cytochrome n=1 Tax=Zoogloea sp. TaxID=49181 RepID=UPI003F2E46D2
MTISTRGALSSLFQAALLALTLGAVTGQAQAQSGPNAREHLERISAAKPADQKTAHDNGKKASFFCANCHGEFGSSKYPEVPNLAGQHPAYVLNQIDAFLTGKRKDAFMQGLMKVLNNEEKASIAHYYSTQIPVPAMATPGPRAAEGRDLYQKHCQRCHGPDARGAESMPRLAGQQVEYLRRSLSRYLKNTGERNYPAMTAAMNGLGESHIEAVAEYLAALR